MLISRYHKNLPLFTAYIYLQGNMLQPLLSPWKLDLEILCFFECKVSALCLISQNFLEACGSFLSIPQRLSDRRRNYPTMSWSVQFESKEFQIISFTILFGRFWDGWWDNLVNYLILFCCFYIFKKLRKVFSNAWKPHKLFKQYAKTVALLSFSQNQIFWKKIFRTFMKTMRYRNRAELFILNGGLSDMKL